MENNSTDNIFHGGTIFRNTLCLQSANQARVEPADEHVGQ